MGGLAGAQPTLQKRSVGWAERSEAHRWRYNTDSTFSGGRPRAALMPETTIGRSTMIGFRAICAIKASSDNFAGSMPAAAASFLRTSARAGIFSLPSNVFIPGAVLRGFGKLDYFRPL